MRTKIYSDLAVASGGALSGSTIKNPEVANSVIEVVAPMVGVLILAGLVGVKILNSIRR